MNQKSKTRYAQMRAWLEPRYPEIFDWSDNARETFFNHESHGTPLSLSIFSNQPNGYQKAHSLINFHITEWRTGILEGCLFKFEILEDLTIPDWLKESFRAATDNVNQLQALYDAYIVPRLKSE